MNTENNFPKIIAEKALSEYKPYYESEKIFLEKMKKFLRENENFAYRSNLSGHFTASVFIIDENFEKILLLHHKKLDKWIQPGGHIDEIDTNFLNAALREAREETGIENFKILSEKIFDIDIHKIPEKNHEPTHFHYDIRYFFQAKSEDLKLNLDESNNSEWVNIDELFDEKIEESIRRMAEKAKNFATFSKLVEANKNEEIIDDEEGL